MTESPHIVFTHQADVRNKTLWSDRARSVAEELGFEVRLNPLAPPLSEEQWAEFFADADAIITTWGAPRLDNAVLARNTRLRFVGHAAGSVAKIASPDLFERGVRLSTANREMARSVANYCLMMTLVGLRDLLAYARFGGARELRRDARMRVRDPRDCVVGVYGYGDVARWFIQRLRPFEPAEILVSDDYLTEEMAREAGVRKVELEEVFARSDVIQLLQSWTQESEGRIGRELFSRIRDGAVLVNAGRAAVTQEAALIEALREQRFTAILDVFHREPLPEDSPLRDMPNVILTPHNAGCEGHGRYVGLMLQEFDRLLKGEPLQYEVTYERAMRMTGGGVK